jgi:ribosomal-protein-alanine N-acetyltransferase
MLNTDEYTIIKAEISHISRIKEINSHLPYDNWSEENFQNAFNWNLPVSLIKNKQEVIVGYLIALYCLEEIKIINVMIDPAYQGLGYGRALMLHVLKDALSQGTQYAMLDVRVTNIPAISLYTALGFAILSVRPNYYTDTIICDAYLMQLRLR